MAIPRNAEKLLRLPHGSTLRDSPPAQTWKPGTIPKPEMDDLMQAVCIFKRVNDIKFVRPTHVYWIMKQLGYRKE